MKTKTTLFLLTVLIAIPSALFAQIEVGVKAGASYSNIKPEKDFSFEDYNYKFGFYAGVFVNMGISESFRTQPELLVETFGTERHINLEWNGYGANITEKLTMTSISLPLPIQYRFSGFYAEAGPQVFYVFGEEWSEINQFGTVYYEPEFGEGFYYGFLAGAGYSFGKMGINARFQKKYLDNDNATVFSLG